MVRLKAKYDIDLKEGAFLITRPVTGDDIDKYSSGPPGTLATNVLSFEADINGFDVELLIDPKNAFPPPAVHPVDKMGYWRIPTISIIVGHDEDIVPYVSQKYGIQRYCTIRSPAYRNVAVEAAKRAIGFFSYRLHNPYLFEPKAIRSPVWSVEGNEVVPTPEITLSTPIYDSRSRFGSEHLSPQDDSELKDALQNPIQPDVTDVLLSNAQSAALHHNIERAVVEIAMACEIAVTRMFVFQEITPANAAYEYLLDEKNITVPVHKRIAGMSEKVFGKSFANEKPGHYKNIQLLFECRNNVVHRYKLTYKDNNGPHNVDENVLEDWWNSVLTLLNWLKDLSA